MKEYFVKFGFNMAMLATGIIIALIMLNGKGIRTENHLEITVKLAKQPIVRNYHFTNPTVYREKTIEYTNTHIITKEDSALIVRDYLKQRIYLDSIFNDTSKVVYHATVEKNALKSINIRHSYKPKEIHTKETRTRQAILLGLSPGWNNGPTIGFFGGFETKQYQYGIQYDPIKNPKGGYLVINKRIFYRK